MLKYRVVRICFVGVLLFPLFFSSMQAAHEERKDNNEPQVQGLSQVEELKKQIEVLRKEKKIWGGKTVQEREQNVYKFMSWVPPADHAIAGFTTLGCYSRNQVDKFPITRDYPRIKKMITKKKNAIHGSELLQEIGAQHFWEFIIRRRKMIKLHVQNKNKVNELKEQSALNKMRNEYLLNEQKLFVSKEQVAKLKHETEVLKLKGSVAEKKLAMDLKKQEGLQKMQQQNHERKQQDLERQHGIAQWSAREQHQLNLLKNVFSARNLLGVTAIVFAVFFVKTLFTWLLIELKPQTIKQTNIAVNLWERVFGKKIYIEEEPMFFNKKTFEEIEELNKSIGRWKEHKHESALHMLLYGSPGVGKTLFVRQLLRRTNLPFIHTSGARLQQMIKKGAINKEIFALFDLAGTQKKAVIFIDEVDLVDQESFKAILDLVREATSLSILLILITNYPNRIPRAVRSRMGIELRIDMPSKETIQNTIESFVNILTKQYGCTTDLTSLDLSEVTEMLYKKKFVQRDIKALVTRACNKAVIGNNVLTKEILKQVVQLHKQRSVEEVSRASVKKVLETPTKEVPKNPVDESSSTGVIIGFIAMVIALILGILIFLKRRK